MKICKAALIQGKLMLNKRKLTLNLRKLTLSQGKLTLNQRKNTVKAKESLSDSIYVVSSPLNTCNSCRLRF